jgi:hypothetical protein
MLIHNIYIYIYICIDAHKHMNHACVHKSIHTLMHAHTCAHTHTSNSPMHEHTCGARPSRCSQCTYPHVRMYANVCIYIWNLSSLTHDILTYFAHMYMHFYSPDRLARRKIHLRLCTHECSSCAQCTCVLIVMTCMHVSMCLYIHKKICLCDAEATR